MSRFDVPYRPLVTWYARATRPPPRPPPTPRLPPSSRAPHDTLLVHRCQPKSAEPLVYLNRDCRLAAMNLKYEPESTVS
jgi:hypothetical protein